MFLILTSSVAVQLTLKLWFHCGCGNAKRWTSPFILLWWCADLRGSFSVQNVNRYLFSFKVRVEDIFCQTVQREDLSVLSHLHIWSDCCMFFFLLFLKWDFRFCYVWNVKQLELYHSECWQSTVCLHNISLTWVSHSFIDHVMF